MSQGFVNPRNKVLLTTFILGDLNFPLSVFHKLLLFYIFSSNWLSTIPH